MSTPLSFDEFRRQVFAHYEQKAYAQALALLADHCAQFPLHLSAVTNWQMCIQARDRQRGPALQTFAEALARGDWWPPAALQADPDLDSLQGNPEFERMVAECAARQARAQAEAKPVLRVIAPPESTPTPYPLLIALHGMGGNAAQSAETWQGLAAQGWLVALAQSSQAISFEGYEWTDLGKAEVELVAHYQALVRDYPVDAERVILAGFSQGGGLAIALAVTGKLPVRGFLAVAPYLPEPEALETPARPVLVRGWLVTGGKDHTDGFVQRSIVALNQRGILFHEERDPERSHEFPPDFAATLPARLAYILGEPE